MESLLSFFSMGGYAAYVWSAYGITFVVMILNVIACRREFAARFRKTKLLRNKRIDSEQGDDR